MGILLCSKYVGKSNVKGDFIDWSPKKVLKMEKSLQKRESVSSLFLFGRDFAIYNTFFCQKSHHVQMDNKCSTYTICVNNKEINITLCVFLAFLVPLKLGLVLEKCAAREQSREYVP